MPTYKYKCEDCGHHFEKALSITEHDVLKPECPKCQGNKVVHAFGDFFAKTSSKS